MRFWRRGVADETAPDPDAIPPEAVEVATAEAPEIATAEPVAAVPVPEPESAYETPSEQLQRWFGRLRTGLSRSSTRLNEGINTIFLRRRLDSVALADAPVMTRPTGSDAAGLAYDAVERAKQDGAEILLIDTAGRLQNKTDLMGELQKIVRVLKKVDANAPHAVLLVLDATVGQNAHAQAEIFREMVGVTGIVMTKLDGTAKGGVLVSLAEKYGIPIHAIGIGEGAEDLRPFEARAYARSLVGLDA